MVPGGARVEHVPGVERVWRFDDIDSTNTFARTLAPVPPSGMLVVTTRRQRAGRGQRGNAFYSDSENGLWLSVVVRPESLGQHFAINRALALGACDVCGDGARIKWPNDIYIGERKAGGILLETSEADAGCIVAGIGLNVNSGPEEFPKDVRTIATSLLMEQGARRDIEAVLCGVVSAFERWRHESEALAHARYERRLMGIGRQAVIGEWSGEYRGVGSDGRAVIAREGEARYFWSGPLRFCATDNGR